jgi:hypothetical protein
MDEQPQPPFPLVSSAARRYRDELEAAHAAICAQALKESRPLSESEVKECDALRAEAAELRAELERIC